MARAGELDYYFVDPKYDPTLLSWKGNSTDISKKHLQWVKNKISESSDAEFETVEKIKSLIFDYATENGRGDVLWPLRVSLSGKEKSPDPFTLIYILGKEVSMKRIERAIELL
jgi:glutamyl-tRNA synthetase